MSYVPRYNHLAHECFWQLAQPVPGRKPGELGSMSVQLDELEALITRRLIEEHGLSPELAAEEAFDAAHNHD